MVLILLTIRLPNSINATKNVEENLKIGKKKKFKCHNHMCASKSLELDP